ncbi:SAF domain-containing protein [Phytohabitans aurantiacus]|uniref:SAF domain-containing protein n=1 Tax=Phytohabitans aurantiacus TaxID=3016789 RepID=A0ABQ5QW72_9ACTN|nr:SAF domain-containing protein [Phytohabitans aurantiacus]GLH98818.1 hypothetical protein Pa4123_40930 [Phytohabitans aurantiacus]
MSAIPLRQAPQRSAPLRSMTAPTAAATGGGGQPPGAVFGRRVRPVRLLASVLLVLAFAVAGAVLAGRLDQRLPVLATSRPLAAGQTITDADLTVVHVAVQGVSLVPETQRDDVVGGTAAVPLPAGVMLSADQVGAPGWPPAGKAVAAVAVKAGRLPSTITAGAHVTVIAVPAADTVDPSTQDVAVRAEATVVHLGTADQFDAGQAGVVGGEVPVSLLMDAAAANQLATTRGDVSLVHHGPGR